MGYLNENGRAIYDRLFQHCSSKFATSEIDTLELEMLANSFALYAECAEICNSSGVKMTFVNDKGGVYEQIRPEYTVMKNEYQNILKHGVKFGLNAADRSKIFKELKEGKKKKGFDTGNKMKVA